MIIRNQSLSQKQFQNYYFNQSLQGQYIKSFTNKNQQGHQLLLESIKKVQTNKNIINDVKRKQTFNFNRDVHKCTQRLDQNYQNQNNAIISVRQNPTYYQTLETPNVDKSKIELGSIRKKSRKYQYIHKCKSLSSVININGLENKDKSEKKDKPSLILQKNLSSLQQFHEHKQKVFNRKFNSMEKQVKYDQEDNQMVIKNINNLYISTDTYHMNSTSNLSTLVNFQNKCKQLQLYKVTTPPKYSHSPNPKCMYKNIPNNFKEKEKFNVLYKYIFDRKKNMLDRHNLMFNSKKINSNREQSKVNPRGEQSKISLMSSFEIKGWEIN